MSYGLVYYHDLLALARHVQAFPGADETKKEVIRNILGKARRISYPGRFVIIGVSDTDIDGNILADRDPGTAEFGKLDSPDCIYWALPPRVLFDYVEHLLETKQVSRGEAIKRIRSNALGLEKLLRRSKHTTTTMASDLACQLAAIVTGNPRVKSLREALKLAAEWHATKEKS